MRWFFFHFLAGNSLPSLLHEINATIILTRHKLMRSEINENDQLYSLRVS